MTISRKLLFIGFILIAFTACRKRDAALPDNLVNFETAAQGIAENETSITVKVKLSRGTDKDLPVVIQLTEEGVAYNTDYTITPAPVNNKITVTVPSGSRYNYWMFQLSGQDYR